MKLFRIFLVPIFFLIAIKANASASCWISIPHNEMMQEWRDENKNKFLRVDMDLNGDGRLDYSEIKISCDKKYAAVFVFLKKNNNKYKNFFLASIPIDQLPAYGVKLASSGSYQTACEKGYFKCLGEQENANFINQSIELFKYEGVSSIFYWDVHSKKIKRVWISD